MIAFLREFRVQNEAFLCSSLTSNVRTKFSPEKYLKFQSTIRDKIEEIPVDILEATESAIQSNCILFSHESSVDARGGLNLLLLNETNRKNWLFTKKDLLRMRPPHVLLRFHEKEFPCRTNQPDTHHKKVSTLISWIKSGFKGKLWR